jgi:RNA-binding protein
MRLSEEQMEYLRVLGHELTPSVQVGAGGLTTFVLYQIDHALKTQELVKVRVPFGDRRRRSDTLDKLAPQTGATLVQRENNAAVLYRPATQPVIDLPTQQRAVQAS